MMNPNNEASIPICCEARKLYPQESPCSKDSSFDLNELMFPNIYDSKFSILENKSAQFIPRYGIECLEHEKFYLEPYPPQNDVYFIMENGTIYIEKSISGLVNYWVGTDDYCFTYDGTMNSTENVLFVCGSSSNDDSSSNRSIYLIAYSIMANLSIPFLIATFLVYTILPELRNVHGLILRMYISGLLMTHTLFGILVAKPTLLCVYTITIIVQYGMLATYLWLNVMSFDIWQTFRTLEDSSKHRNRRKFAMYSIYAWGLSALITGVSSTIDLIPTLPEWIIRPGLYGSCWFTDDAASAIYFHGPIDLTIISNIVFFTLTATKMFQHEKRTAQQLKRQTDEKQRFKLYLKLFMVMGMVEATQLVSLMWPDVPTHITLILDAPGALQGLSIFIIFVCKKNILQLLFKRLRCQCLCLEKLTYKRRRNNSSVMSTTSSVITSLQEQSNITSV